MNENITKKEKEIKNEKKVIENTAKENENKISEKKQLHNKINIKKNQVTGEPRRFYQAF